MATEYKLSYTGSEINEKLGKIDSLAEKNDIPTKTSQLDNDSGFLTSAPVTSVNGKTGAVTITVPTALKNPNALTINGVSYDGSETKDFTDAINTMIDSKLASITNAEEVPF